VKPTVIVTTASNSGGMEKRLAGLFLHLVKDGAPVRLVVAQELAAKLRVTDEYKDLAAHEAQLIPFPGDESGVPGPWFPRFRALMRRLGAEAPDGVFHYGLVSPFRAHRSRSRRVLYTIPNSALDQYSRRGLAVVAGGIVRAPRVDILDPNVHRKLSRAFFWRRDDFSLTPGSFVDCEVFRPLPAREKKNLIVFTGLFSHAKQAPRLAAAVPAILQQLDAAGLHDAELWMLGREAAGGVTDSVTRLGTPRARAFPSTDVRSVLAEAKVFLSLQYETNHPSKALLEGMACGCAPIVTDTRDSEKTAPRELASYVPRDFTATDIARAAIPLLQRSDDEIDAHAVRMRAHLRANFSIEAMSTYYPRLYEELSR
jgi:glycosyltransferase involved in cell wall biosynthesis